MARQRALQIGERRTIHSSRLCGLTPGQLAFADVSVERFGDQPLLRLLFGDVYQELSGDVARDFGVRVARAMKTRVVPGSRRGFRAGKALTREQRQQVEVFMHDDFGSTWLHLEFADGNVVDFSVNLSKDFADRIARATLLIQPDDEREKSS